MRAPIRASPDSGVIAEQNYAGARIAMLDEELMKC
jgi:hypothetical protein